MFGLFNKKVTLKQTAEANITGLYAVKDKKLETFLPTVECPNAEEWKKSYIQLARSDKHKENALVMHAQDFDLYQLGTVNKNNGKITGLDSPLHCFNLEDLKK